MNQNYEIKLISSKTSLSDCKLLCEQVVQNFKDKVIAVDVETGVFEWERIFPVNVVQFACAEMELAIVFHISSFGRLTQNQMEKEPRWWDIKFALEHTLNQADTVLSFGGPDTELIEKFLKRKVKLKNNVDIQKLLVVAGAGGRSLKNITKLHLDIDLDKRYQLADWSKHKLSRPEVIYAANDAIILQDLYAQFLKDTNKLEETPFSKMLDEEKSII